MLLVVDGFHGIERGELVGMLDQSEIEIRRFGQIPGRCAPGSGFQRGISVIALVPREDRRVVTAVPPPGHSQTDHAVGQDAAADLRRDEFPGILVPKLIVVVRSIRSLVVIFREVPNRRIELCADPADRVAVLVAAEQPAVMVHDIEIVTLVRAVPDAGIDDHSGAVGKVDGIGGADLLRGVGHEIGVGKTGRNSEREPVPCRSRCAACERLFVAVVGQRDPVRHQLEAPGPVPGPRHKLKGCGSRGVRHGEACPGHGDVGSAAAARRGDCVSVASRSVKLPCDSAAVFRDNKRIVRAEGVFPDGSGKRVKAVFRTACRTEGVCVKAFFIVIQDRIFSAVQMPRVVLAYERISQNNLTVIVFRTVAFEGVVAPGVVQTRGGRTRHLDIEHAGYAVRKQADGKRGLVVGGEVHKQTGQNLHVELLPVNNRIEVIVSIGIGRLKVPQSGGFNVAVPGPGDAVFIVDVIAEIVHLSSPGDGQIKAVAGKFGQLLRGYVLRADRRRAVDNHEHGKAVRFKFHAVRVGGSVQNVEGLLVRCLVMRDVDDGNLVFQHRGQEADPHLDGNGGG